MFHSKRPFLPYNADISCHPNHVYVVIQHHIHGRSPFGLHVEMAWMARYRTDLALEVVQNDVAWAAAKVGVVTQVGAWYNVCSVTKAAVFAAKKRTEVVEKRRILKGNRVKIR